MSYLATPPYLRDPYERARSVPDSLRQRQDAERHEGRSRFRSLEDGLRDELQAARAGRDAEMLTARLALDPGTKTLHVRRARAWSRAVAGVAWRMQALGIEREDSL